jgi:hypothetical protein
MSILLCWIQNAVRFFPISCIKLIEVSYEFWLPGMDSELQSKIVVIAKKFKGSEIGSGSGFGERSISLEFPARKSAEKAMEEIGALLSQRGGYWSCKFAKKKEDI